MWRSIFLAGGIYLVIIGLECFVLEQVELRRGGRPLAPGVTSSPYQTIGFTSAIPAAGTGRTYRPKEWMPWSLLAAGTIIILYTSSRAPRPEPGGG
jgi:hypothetical protein